MPRYLKWVVRLVAVALLLACAAPGRAQVGRPPVVLVSGVVTGVSAATAGTLGTLNIKCPGQPEWPTSVVANVTVINGAVVRPGYRLSSLVSLRVVSATVTNVKTVRGVPTGVLASLTVTR